MEKKQRKTAKERKPINGSTSLNHSDFHTTAADGRKSFFSTSFPLEYRSKTFYFQKSGTSTFKMIDSNRPQ